VVILALLAGCLPEFADGSVLGELRVMSVVSTPPEVVPGQVVAVDAFIADPREEGFDVLMWACKSDVQCIWNTPEITGSTASWVRDVPHWAGFDELGSDEVPAAVWTLACTPGTCPQIE
jgi:hypothetical protein